jgi:hypothetical protein
MRTTFYKGIEGSCNSRTVSAQFLAETEGRKMRFPKIINHRRFEATIYGKSENTLITASPITPPENGAPSISRHSAKLESKRKV